MHKKILGLDFDGVLNGYQSGWIAAHFIPDPPVPGAIEFLEAALGAFDEVHIYSSRANGDGGVRAMQTWVKYWVEKTLPLERANQLLNSKNIVFATQKPPAMVMLDDRALTFTGKFPTMDELLAFKPWNHKETPEWPSPPLSSSSP